MKNENKQMTLSRSDITMAARNSSIEDINIDSFRAPLVEIWQAETVVFIDDDGARKVLKDRRAV